MILLGKPWTKLVSSIQGQSMGCYKCLFSPTVFFIFFHNDENYLILSDNSKGEFQVMIKLVVVKIPISWLHHFEDIRILKNYCVSVNSFLTNVHIWYLLKTSWFLCVFRRYKLEKLVRDWIWMKYWILQEANVPI